MATTDPAGANAVITGLLALGSIVLSGGVFVAQQLWQRQLRRKEADEAEARDRRKEQRQKRVQRARDERALRLQREREQREAAAVQERVRAEQAQREKDRIEAEVRALQEDVAELHTKAARQEEAHQGLRGTLDQILSDLRDVRSAVLDHPRSPRGKRR